MDEERKDEYYEVIREKITDPEIQKALDAFHARGVEEQRLRGEAAAPRPAEPDGYGARSPQPPAEPAGYRPQEPVRPPQETPRQRPAANPQGTGTAAGTRDPAVYREYMQRSGRQSDYTDAPADDAYTAAYRAAMRKAAGEKAAELRGSRARFAVGILTVLFAVFGLVCAAVLCVKGIAAFRTEKNEERCAAYAARLVAFAAVDPEPFDDISDAAMEDLIKISLWSIIGSGVDPNQYAYANGELCIPQADAEAAYIAYFGTQRPIVHGSAEGYGYTFQYSAEDAAYYIPMTTLEPLYTPKVTSVEIRSGATVVTCGLIGSGLWKQDSLTGDITAPDPDRYIRVTFRSASGAEYINSVQSLGLPETAIPSGYSSPEPQTETGTDETTTEAETRIVITWD